MTTLPPIYLDGASTTPCADEVVAAMQPYWSLQFGNAAAAGIEGRRAAQAVQQAKTDVARLIGADAAGITFTSGATEANFLALAGAAAARADKSRNEILISAAEHDSVFAAAASLAAQGYIVKTIPVDSGGVVNVAALSRMLSPRSFLVSIIAVGHETGTVQDIPALCRLAHAAGALFHADAVQAVGKMPVNAAAWGADMITICAHKIYGPQGIGALYVRLSPPVPMAPVMGGSGGQVLRAGTVPLALAVGFGAACRLAGARLADDIAAAGTARDAFLSEWQDANMPLHVNGAAGVPHILNMQIDGVDAADMMLDLASSMTFSTGSACRSASGKSSAVLAAMGLDEMAASQSVRLSFGRGLSADDARRAARLMAEYVLKQRHKAD